MPTETSLQVGCVGSHGEYGSACILMPVSGFGWSVVMVSHFFADVWKHPQKKNENVLISVG